MLDSLQRSADRVETSRFNVIVIVAMQHQAAPDRDPCLAALKRIGRTWVARSNLPLVGMAMTGCSKITAINELARLACEWHAQTIGWFDEDVLVEQDCVSALLSELSLHPTAVVGAAKTALPDHTWFSSWWARRKNSIEPRNRYPHGCGVMLSQGTLKDGIPSCYHSDDHYLLLTYLNPLAPDPYERLRVPSTAVVYVPAPNTAPAIVFRVARNFRNVLRMLADAPPQTVEYFLRRILFADLRAPSGMSDIFSITYWRRYCWQVLKCAFWLGVASEVVLRGIAGRPRTLDWYSAPYPERLRHSRGSSTTD